MIGFQKQLSKQQRGTQSILQQAVKGFAGGGNKPKPIDPSTTDYDIIFVGKSSYHLRVSKRLPGFYFPSESATTS